MPTRNVVLTDRHHKMIDRLVKTGRYQNASEVLRDGLRLVQAQELAQREKLRRIRDAVDLAVADVERGDVHEFATRSEAAAFLKQIRADATGGRRRRA